MRRIIALAAILTACNAYQVPTPVPPPAPPPAPSPLVLLNEPALPPPLSIQPVRVELFVMSRCPYCAGVESAMLEALREAGRAVDFSLDYVGNFDPDGTLRSMHGDSEVIGDLAQVCAARLAPQRFLAMIVCQNSD